MHSTSVAVSCNDIYSSAKSLSPQRFQGSSPTNYNSILQSPQSIGDNAEFGAARLNRGAR